MGMTIGSRNGMTIAPRMSATNATQMKTSRPEPATAKAATPIHKSRDSGNEKAE